MKRLIPYIASQYRKDAIWLRRTRPHARCYQVLVAIDDSQSMASHGAARLALEACCVLCTSLQQLEVGQVSVVSFGRQVELLHDFTSPFTADSGAYIASKFTFAQQETRWLTLLERLITQLDEARSSMSSSSSNSSSIASLQLCFLLSDARVQQDRSHVARLTREAMSHQQLLVLLIIDTQDENESILNTKTVSYSSNGTMSINSYLDDFPFPFFIVVRNVQQMPTVIAEALRQWFQILSKQDI